MVQESEMTDVLRLLPSTGFTFAENPTGLIHCTDGTGTAPVMFIAREISLGATVVRAVVRLGPDDCMEFFTTSGRKIEDL